MKTHNEVQILWDGEEEYCIAKLDGSTTMENGLLHNPTSAASSSNNFKGNAQTEFYSHTVSCMRQQSNLICSQYVTKGLVLAMFFRELVIKGQKYKRRVQGSPSGTDHY